MSKSLARTYYEFSVTYKGKKVDQFLFPATSAANAWDEASQKATDNTKIKLIRIIGPEEGSL